MSTLKLYLENSNIFQVTAVVEETGFTDGRPWVRLNRTIFHPQGGGQKADRGRIGEVPVLHVAHAEEGEVRHFVAHSAPFSTGQQVELHLDPVWRALGARTHSAGHLIAALVEQRFRSLRAVAGHHWPGEARVEFEGSVVSPEEVASALIDDIQKVISFDPLISVVGDPYVERSIQIGDFAPVPCGGTHVRSLAALDGMQVDKVRSKSGRLRVSYSIPTQPLAQ